MIFRRFALLIGLAVAVLASQLPEFAQQYRQRIGGALDELNALVAGFDTQAQAQSLDRNRAIARLKANDDPLARERGASMADTVTRRDRLQLQKDIMATASPLSQVMVLAEGLDPGVARQAFADFQPAVPVTPSGFVSGGIGLVLGWLATHLLAWPIRRRRAPRQVAATTAV